VRVRDGGRPTVRFRINPDAEDSHPPMERHASEIVMSRRDLYLLSGHVAFSYLYEKRKKVNIHSIV